MQLGFAAAQFTLIMGAARRMLFDLGRRRMLIDLGRRRALIDLGRRRMLRLRPLVLLRWQVPNLRSCP